MDILLKFKKYIKDNKNIVIPLLLFFVTFLIFNFLAPHQSHDKGWATMFNQYGGLSWGSFGLLIKDWFYSHNNRLPIEILAILFVQNPVGIIIFRLINPIFATISFYLILKVIDSKNLTINTILFLLVFTIDGKLVYDVGLVSVCSNYIWPLTLATPALIIVINHYRDQNYKPSKPFFITSIVLLVIYALWSEMFALVFGVAIALYLIMFYIKNKKIDYRCIVYLSLAVAFFIFAYVAPSTKVRYNNTIKNHFPTYVSFTFFSKCWFGIVETYNDYMKLFNLMFILLLVYVSFTSKKTNKLLKINSLMPVLHFIIYNSLFNSYVLNYNSGVNAFYSKYIRIISEIETTKPTATGVPFLGAFFAILFFAHILISLIFLSINKEKKVMIISCYLIGLASKACLGFTPRYYVTYRTQFYVVIFTLIQSGIILDCVFNKQKNKKLNQ